MEQAYSLTQDQTVPPQALRVYTAPPESGDLVLGKTLVDLLDEACEAHNNETALNQLTAAGWTPLSTLDFRRRAENLALGLLELGVKRGDRVGFYTHSDVSFCLGDMACLLAGLVDVPIYLTHTEGAIKHILGETESQVLICSDEQLLADIAPLLGDTSIKKIILWTDAATTLNLPDTISLHTFAEIEGLGENNRVDQPHRLAELRSQIGAQDLATLIYTSGTTGQPKGVMLTHENISSNVIANMTGLQEFRAGPGAEVALSFLPLTHIFARTLHYCMMWYGTSVYFSDPERLREDLKEVKPTFFASVPRVLEKAYERIMATGASLTGVKRTLFDWSLDLARRFDVEEEPTGLYALQLGLADKLVLSKWREALGGNIKTIIVGGAALRADLVNTFGAAGIKVLQGYGLTETSPVITYNRGENNRAGTVGVPLAGVEVKLSVDNEIMTRGPHVMKGYYKNADKTAEVLDAEGWFHTGDLGEISDDGFLRITGRLKNLFKISTGKYVMPQPLEDALEAEALIDTALVVGEGEKYCAALIFINQDALGSESLDAAKDRIANLIKRANADMPAWSQVKRAALISDELTVANGLLTPKMSVKRSKVVETFGAQVAALYDSAQDIPEGTVILEL